MLKMLALNSNKVLFRSVSYSAGICNYF